MALATRCPHCRTTFRVANDQLKLRAGLVRCGSCKQIFNGLEHLLPPAEPAAPPAVQDTTARQPSPDIPDTMPLTPQPSTAAVPHPADEPAAAQPELEPRPEPDPNDPMNRMTLLDFSVESPGAAPHDPESQDMIAGKADDLEQAIDNLAQKPWRAADAQEESEIDHLVAPDPGEPSFVKRGRRQQRMARMTRILLTVSSVALLAALAGQALYTFRDHLAAWFPQTKPLLADACALVGCRIELLRQIDAVSLESSELQALNAEKTGFVLTTLLRNRSAVPQAWPHIELTLNDLAEKTVARRVFSPREYLPAGQDGAKGVPPHSEQAIKLFLDLSQLKASGYRVYVFYP